MPQNSVLRHCPVTDRLTDIAGDLAVRMWAMTDTSIAAQKASGTAGRFGPLVTSAPAATLQRFGTSVQDRIDEALQYPPEQAYSDEWEAFPDFPYGTKATFTNQHCAALADEMHERTGWPVVTVGDGPNGVVGWVHAGVLAPDGRIVDVCGAHRADEWLTSWAEDVDAYGADDDQYDDDDVSIYTADDSDSGYAESGRLSREPAPPEHLVRETAAQILAPRR